MIKKITKEDIPTIHKRLYVGRESVTKITKDYGYSQNCAFHRALKNLGYKIVSAVVENK